MPGGTIEYYNRVKRELGGGYAQTQTFARLFLAPGVGHCGGGVGPQPQGLLDAVVNWVENGQAPERILSSNPIPGGTRTRPLCPYPKFAVYTGHGSTDDEANFVCRRLQHEGENEGEDQDD
jgi:feruloyl esterase